MTETCVVCPYRKRMYEKMVDSVFPVLKKLSVHPVFSFPTSDGKPETAVFRQKQFDRKVETLFPA